MALNPSNSSILEQLALKGLSYVCCQNELTLVESTEFEFWNSFFDRFCFLFSSAFLLFPHVIGGFLHDQLLQQISRIIASERVGV